MSTKSPALYIQCHRSVKLAGYSILDIGHSNVQCPISNIRLTSRSSMSCYFKAQHAQMFLPGTHIHFKTNLTYNLHSAFKGVWCSNVLNFEGIEIDLSNQFKPSTKVSGSKLLQFDLHYCGVILNTYTDVLFCCVKIILLYLCEIMHYE